MEPNIERLDEKLLPCPFCGSALVEAHAFATRTTKMFVHPNDDDNPCVGQSIRVGTDDADRIAAWNRRSGSLSPAVGVKAGELPENILEDAAKSAFVKAQSVYRADHDHFPLTTAWETTSESVREGWRGIAYAALEAAYMPPLGTQPEPRQPRDVAAVLSALSPSPKDEAKPDIVPDHCTSSALAFSEGVLCVNNDGSGYIAVDEDHWSLEDDRVEGPDGPEGSVHWITRLNANEVQALRDFLNGSPRANSAPVSLEEVAGVLEPAARDMLAERQRQVEVEGWTPEHDDLHDKGEMALAAATYACFAAHDEADRSSDGISPMFWPWDRRWWKPTTPRRDLIKAGALILAEIERIDRAIASKIRGAK